MKCTRTDLSWALGLTLAFGGTAWAQDGVAYAGRTPTSAALPLPDRIVATALTPDVVTGWNGDETLDLVFNNEGDRLGAQYTNTETGEDHPVDQVSFVFSQLKLDPKTKNILLGSVVIGNYGAFHLRLIPGYRLKCEKNCGIEDKGFDREKVCHLSVFLERKR